MSPFSDVDPVGVTLQSTSMFLAPQTLLASSDPLGVEPDTLHVWAFALEGEPRLVEACRTLLVSEERQRADRFVFERDRIRYTVAHGVLRHPLSRYCDLAP